jgi:NAD(P)-dependent dehydrogenase (short-subunit alcohol dehydrogenase family)
MYLTSSSAQEPIKSRHRNSAQHVNSRPDLLAASSPAGKLSLVQLDILDPSSIQAAVETVQKLLPGGLDVFLSNAGVDLQSLVPFEKL